MLKYHSNEVYKTCSKYEKQIGLNFYSSRSKVIKYLKDKGFYIASTIAVVFSITIINHAKLEITVFTLEIAPEPKEQESDQLRDEDGGIK